MSDVRPRCIALPLESDGPGGAETMLLQFAEELRRRGHHVIPVGPARGHGWLGEQFRQRGFEPSTFEIRRPLDPGTVRGLARLFRSRAVELVHSHEFTMCVYCAVAGRMVGIPHVTTMHGHMAFFGAYAMISFGIMTYALPDLTGRSVESRQTSLGLAAFWLMVGGMFGMTMALAAAGITQTYLERILGLGYLETQQKIQVHYLMWLGTAVVFSLGAMAFLWDFATAGPPRPRAKTAA